MADLTQTAANVGLTDVAGASVAVSQAGEALTQGMAIYQLTSDNKWYKADVTTSATTAAATAIVLTPAATDEYFVRADEPSTVDLGATLTVGETYVVSAAGAISPIGDLTTGDYPTILGTATTTGKLPLTIFSSGVQKP